MCLLALPACRRDPTPLVRIFNDAPRASEWEVY